MHSFDSFAHASYSRSAVTAAWAGARLPSTSPSLQSVPSARSMKSSSRQSGRERFANCHSDRKSDAERTRTPYPCSDASTEKASSSSASSCCNSVFGDVNRTTAASSPGNPSARTSSADRK